MRLSHFSRSFGRALVLAISLITATVAGSSQAQADPVTALVPAYFYPTWWLPTGSPWDQLNAAAATIPIEAIMNPSSGPGPAFNPDYGVAVAALQAAGGKVIGYVAYFRRHEGDRRCHGGRPVVYHLVQRRRDLPRPDGDPIRVGPRLRCPLQPDQGIRTGTCTWSATQGRPFIQGRRVPGRCGHAQHLRRAFYQQRSHPSQLQALIPNVVLTRDCLSGSRMSAVLRLRTLFMGSRRIWLRTWRSSRPWGTTPVTFM